jgi:hypothetical protein
MSEEVEETNSGVKKKGNWEEVAEFGEEVEEAVKEDLDDESVKDFQEWRPKKEEAENDMKKKTVDKAVINEKKMETESEGVKDFKNASEKIAEAGKKAAKKQKPSDEITEASEEVARPIYSRIAKFFRGMEKIVYSKIALRKNPYYFDAKNFSASFKSGKKEYEMEVNVLEDNTRDKMKESFEEQD